jgi:hypothetical protein
MSVPSGVETFEFQPWSKSLCDGDYLCLWTQFWIRSFPVCLKLHPFVAYVEFQVLIGPLMPPSSRYNTPQDHDFDLLWLLRASSSATKITKGGSGVQYPTLSFLKQSSSRCISFLTWSSQACIFLAAYSSLRAHIWYHVIDTATDRPGSWWFLQGSPPYTNINSDQSTGERDKK